MNRRRIGQETLFGCIKHGNPFTLDISCLPRSLFRCNQSPHCLEFIGAIAHLQVGKFGRMVEQDSEPVEKPYHLLLLFGVSFRKSEFGPIVVDAVKF